MREHSASELQHQMDYNGTKETTFMEETYTTCDWCRTPITYGNASLTINRNIEQG